MRLGAAVEGRDNLLTPLRLAAASGVLVSHAWPLSLGPTAVQPLQGALGLTLGELCVRVFFAVSGFLVALSFQRARGLGDWALARALRLLPGLAVATTATAFLLGPAVTALPLGDYLADPRTLSYPLRNTAMLALQYDLPGVFEANPWPGAVNGSLWTLYHEVACYAMTALLGVCGLLRGGPAAAAFVAAFLAVSTAAAAFPEALAGEPRLRDFLTLGQPFVIGVALCLWRDRAPLSLPLAAALWLAVAALRAGGAPPAATALAVAAAVAYAALALGFAARGVWPARWGDPSYGVYVYAFPVQQAAALAGAVTPLANVAVAAPATLALAALSWFWVERPALRRRAALHGALTGRLAPLLRRGRS